MPRFLDLSAKFPVGGSMKRPKSITYQDPTGQVKAPMVLFNANTQKATALGKPDRCVLHWTAGGGRSPWDDYHYNIINDTDNIPAVILAVAKGRKGQHLYKRNTGAVGFTFCASGPDKVSAPMLEMMAKLLAEYCHKNGLDPAGKTHDGFWVLGDHAEYAKADKYYPHRWDIGALMEPLRRKAIWYHSKISDTKPVYEFGPIL